MQVYLWQREKQCEIVTSVLFLTLFLLILKWGRGKKLLNSKSWLKMLYLIKCQRLYPKKVLKLITKKKKKKLNKNGSRDFCPRIEKITAYWTTLGS